MKRILLNKSKGFTLIELLVVMGVIVILISFLAPSLKGYIGKAQKLKAINTGRQLYTATFESFIENNGKLSKEKIEETASELLGIGNITVTSDTSDTSEKITNSDEVYITYHADSKEYLLKFKIQDNGFSIIQDKDTEKENDEDKVIYTSLKQDTN
ncbi:type II secretion system protein [Clostridium aestuarii]|uniref:Type II secretion system protein n=1 Tax=Clostridium aestuarii TaxID=338193 RepID=A0ABT4CXM2_9CLOT|nr:type II secretion system protein [Clostridium aestuarii]MCY6483738.1 type II secretion system protein [Clostridium aestuarii]